jgi:hypothetical protein
MSDADLEVALDEAGVRPEVADAIVEENEQARIAALQVSLSILAVLGVLALFAARRLPTTPAGDRSEEAHA